MALHNCKRICEGRCTGTLEDHVTSHVTPHVTHCCVAGGPGIPESGSTHVSLTPEPVVCSLIQTAAASGGGPVHLCPACVSTKDKL